MELKKSKKNVREFQRVLLNSWPAKDYFFLNGWILRFNDGVTSRANSVIPLNYNGNRKMINNDIDIVEKAYLRYKLPPIFTMHDYYKPCWLHKELEERGYQPFSYTCTMGAFLHSLVFNTTNEKFSYHFYAERTRDFSIFLAKYSKRSIEEQKILKDLTSRIIIPRKCFIVAKHQEKVIGTLMGVLNPYGYLYLADIVVDPEYRREGIANSMINMAINKWTFQNGVNIIWLQVEVDNTPAINLYRKIGMKKIYNYHYLKKEQNK
jgi:ribosomal protein S18 acetylase RimI-like enzyme